MGLMISEGSQDLDNSGEAERVPTRGCKIKNKAEGLTVDEDREP